MTPEDILTHYIAACVGAAIGFFVAGLLKVGKNSDPPPPPPSREAGRRYCGND